MHTLSALTNTYCAYADPDVAVARASHELMLAWR
jgi:hypothetical protein